MLEEFDRELDLIMEARRMSEEEGKRAFICPICGGACYWIRTANHVFVRCEKCGISLREE